MKDLKILVTGAAGFIGSALCLKLLEEESIQVVGVDNLNDYYDVKLKEDRLERITGKPNFRFEKIDISDKGAMESLFKKEGFHRVVNLAAQAGVRHSLEHAHDYIAPNLTGFINILENCRHHKIEHLVYASTSSVYGINGELPFSEHQGTQHPASLYAATKKANEMLAHSYGHMFGLPTTGLRFFTVYGPWGRPDMALFKFTKNIVEGKPIDVYNRGDHLRDFTYVDDIVEGVARVTLGEPSKSNPNWDPKKPDPATSSAPYRIFNIGNSKTVELTRYIELIEEYLGKKAERNLLPAQPGDVHTNHADVSELNQAYDYRPTTPVEVGVKKFIDWYKEYYRTE